MSGMTRASIRRSLPLLLAVMLVVPTAWGRGWRHRGRYMPPPPTCTITVKVIRSWDSQPVNNAAVVFQPVNTENKPWGNMELKTNEKGVAKLNLIPIGSRLLLQVLAPGFQTYGKIFDLPKATKSITVKLDPPAPQVSIYKKQAKQSGSGQSQSGKKPQN